MNLKAVPSCLGLLSRGIIGGNLPQGTRDAAESLLLGADAHPSLCSSCQLSAENPLRSPQQHAVEPPQALDPELTCPLCERVFPASELQVFEDHVYCHSL